MKSKFKKYIIALLSLFFILFLLYFFVYRGLTKMGWSGREQWIYRRQSVDRDSAIARGVFIKDLKYFSSEDSFGDDFFIEKGWRYNKKGMFYPVNTHIKTKYPYQLCLIEGASSSNHHVLFRLINEFTSDSVSIDLISTRIFLREPKLKDTILFKIINFDKKRDSIGYIKVWDDNCTINGTKNK